VGRVRKEIAKENGAYMNINFTEQELKAIKFAIVSDLETLQNMIDSGDAELRNIGELANLNNALAKINKVLKR